MNFQNLVFEFSRQNLKVVQGNYRRHLLLLEICHLNFPAVWRTITKSVKEDQEEEEEGHAPFLDLSACAAGKNMISLFVLFTSEQTSNSFCFPPLQADEFALEVKLWPRLFLDHLCHLPRIRAVCINGCNPMCQVECRQNVLDIWLALPGGIPV